MSILDCEISHLRLPVLSHLPSKFIFPVALLAVARRGKFEHTRYGTRTTIPRHGRPSPWQAFFLALAGYFPASAEKITSPPAHDPGHPATRGYAAASLCVRRCAQLRRYAVPLAAVTASGHPISEGCRRAGFVGTVLGRLRRSSDCRSANRGTGRPSRPSAAGCGIGRIR